MLIKFIYSEKATKFCEISTNYLSYVLRVKLLVEILQNFVAFSEYMNFKKENLVKERFGSNPESLRQEAKSSEPNISWDLLT